MNQTNKTALTIAGSDPSGGAGIQADIKTFSAFDTYGMTAITALTAGNTCGVEQIQKITPQFVAAQIQIVRKDIPPDTVKTGMLGSAAIIKKVAEQLEDLSVPLVVDPVITTNRGDLLLSKKGIRAYRKYLLPQADIITPNIPEAEQLAQISISSHQAMPEAAGMAQQYTPLTAAKKAKKYINQAIKKAPELGHGEGPIHL